MQDKPRVLVLTTGGTIEKAYDESDGTLLNRGSYVSRIIEDTLRLPYTEVVVKSILSKDSLNMGPSDRRLICHNITRHLFQPVVILHGTDTMEKTAQYCYENIHEPKYPIIFTGAMKPLEMKGSDAIQNLTEALMAAKIVEPGVYISFHNRLFKAPGVRKNRQLNTFETHSQQTSFDRA